MAATKVMSSPSRDTTRDAGEGLASAVDETSSPAPPERVEPAPSHSLPRKRGRVRVGAVWVRVHPRHLTLGLKDRAAVDDRAPHPALHRAPVERRVLRFRAKIVGADAPGVVRVEKNEIGGSTRRQPANRETEDTGWVRGQAAHQVDEAEMAIVVELERQGQQRFEP